MGRNSAIEWTRHSFNPWRGCTKVSPGCAHCYAEVQSKRNPKVLGIWGQDGTRPIGSEAYWRQPLKWDQEAAAAGERHRVFCASLADVFEDRPVLVAPRWRLMQLIEQTSNLDWLLLTKRPENVLPLLGQAIPLNERRGDDATKAGELWISVHRQIWVGTSCEDQQRYDQRMPHLIRLPAIVRFISFEPLLGPIDPTPPEHRGTNWNLDDWLQHVEWAIVGGESGANARPMHPDWARQLRDRCVHRTDAGRPWPMPFFFKQWGEWAPVNGVHGDRSICARVGKHAAGRRLDGREYSEIPELGYAAPGGRRR